MPKLNFYCKIIVFPLFSNNKEQMRDEKPIQKSIQRIRINWKDCRLRDVIEYVFYASQIIF